jgi:lipopolysaccharide export system protein LptA
MRLRKGITIAGLLLGLLAGLRSQAQIGQVEFRTPANDSVKVVDILSDDVYHFEQPKDSGRSATTLVGNVAVRQGKTIIYCDSMIIIKPDNYIDCYGHVHINDNDSVNIYSDYMKYLVDSQMVFFRNNVRLTDGKGILTTPILNYDLKTKIGVYSTGGRLVSKETVLTSEEGTYYEYTKDIHFHRNVILRDPQYDLTCDSLLYNTQTQISTFISETFIQFKDSSRRTIRTHSGHYDVANHKAEFGSRPIMVEGSQRLTGDSVRMDDSTGLATAVGNAIYMDTAQGMKLLAGVMVNNKKNRTFFATVHPLMILKQENKDSLYVTADTLMSARLVDYQDQQKILAHQDSIHHIFIDSIEKVSADSLHRLALLRATRDSIIKANGGDTTHINDISDSLGIGGADSLARLGLDSLNRLRHFPTVSVREIPIIKDSTGKKLITSADSLRLHPPTEKELRRQAEAKIKAARQARKDSISDLKEKKHELADSLRTAQKKLKDSLAIRQQDIADSIQGEKAKERARKRAVADSIRQSVVNDSLKVIAIADSIRHQSLLDSLDRVGLSDSANALRRQDSINLAKRLRRPPTRDTVEAPLPGHEADSIALIPTTDTALRYVIGFHHVRIFSDSLQAVCDSLYYSAKDSIFRLFYNPVAWGGGNYQITGDTMYVYTKNKKANRLYVFENGLAVNKIGKVFYDQLKGTTINAFFKGGEIDYIRARGNAESIYYVTDEKKAYTSVNKAHADIIDMRFVPKTDSAGKPAGKELNRVVLRNDAEGTMYPFKHVVFEDMVLRGFKWQEARRPKSKKELFEDVKRKQDEDIDEIEVPVSSAPAPAPTSAPPGKGSGTTPPPPPSGPPH